MLGLKRGTVELVSHQPQWRATAQQTIATLKSILGTAAVDVQHVGSTAIDGICAKPIIDLAVAVRALEDIKPYIPILAEEGIQYRKEDVAEQLLFVIGEGEWRTHHIHVVQWNGTAWHNYLNFRDYLNAVPEKAKQYEACKMELADRFSQDRASYTAGKQALIDCLLQEARQWRAGRENAIP